MRIEMTMMTADDDEGGGWVMDADGGDGNGDESCWRLAMMADV